MNIRKKELLQELKVLIRKVQYPFGEDVFVLRVERNLYRFKGKDLTTPELNHIPCKRLFKIGATVVNPDGSKHILDLRRK